MQLAPPGFEQCTTQTTVIGGPDRVFKWAKALCTDVPDLFKSQWWNRYLSSFATLLRQFLSNYHIGSHWLSKLYNPHSQHWERIVMWARGNVHKNQAVFMDYVDESTWEMIIFIYAFLPPCCLVSESIILKAQIKSRLLSLRGNSHLLTGW